MPSKSSLVIFLHGIGASGAQLMPLAASWRSSLPNTRFAAPDA
ncbi:phospholipase, partial [Rhizobium laguerreae]|nr:phospholipase [Rhizobium laguerreae]MBY3550786.1 phospholipase [Rhizobium laguerreae]